MYIRRRLKAKVVIVINGKGGVGKDTFCDIASKLYYAESISSITPIKEIAMYCGWNGGKDYKSRRFLSDLKRLLVNYNDLPNRYLIDHYRTFKRNAAVDVLFVHIREPLQISDFISRLDGKYITLLVQSNRPSIPRTLYGNSSDDDVEQYDYDYKFVNDYALKDLYREVGGFLEAMFKSEGLLA